MSDDKDKTQGPKKDQETDPKAGGFDLFGGTGKQKDPNPELPSDLADESELEAEPKKTASVTSLDAASGKAAKPDLKVVDTPAKDNAMADKIEQPAEREFSDREVADKAFHEINEPPKITADIHLVGEHAELFAFDEESGKLVPKDEECLKALSQINDKDIDVAVKRPGSTKAYACEIDEQSRLLNIAKNATPIESQEEGVVPPKFSVEPPLSTQDSAAGPMQEQSSLEYGTMLAGAMITGLMKGLAFIGAKFRDLLVKTFDVMKDSIPEPKPSRSLDSTEKNPIKPGEVVNKTGVAGADKIKQSLQAVTASQTSEVKIKAEGLTKNWKTAIRSAIKDIATNTKAGEIGSPQINSEKDFSKAVDRATPDEKRAIKETINKARKVLSELPARTENLLSGHESGLVGASEKLAIITGMRQALSTPDAQLTQQERSVLKHAHENGKSLSEDIRQSTETTDKILRSQIEAQQHTLSESSRKQNWNSGASAESAAPGFA